MCLAAVAPSFRALPNQLREQFYETLFDLPVRRTQTGDLLIPDLACLPAGRCSDSRGQGAGPSRAAFPCLRTQKIPLDPPVRRW